MNKNKGIPLKGQLPPQILISSVIKNAFLIIFFFDFKKISSFGSCVIYDQGGHDQLDWS